MNRVRLALPTLTAAVFVAAFAGTVAAQDELALKKYFEGRSVTLRMDMPGSADGVDIQVAPPRSIDYKKYRDSLKRNGVAINSGDSSTVTMIRLKKDLIEFQIGGGGFGTFGDDTSTSSDIRLIDRSEREKTLEKQVKSETDRDRKRSLQRELDDLRDRRERQNRLLQAQKERIEAAKRERVARERLNGGSRFNLRWEGRVPPTLGPDDVEKALVEYVDFRGASANGRRTPGDVSLIKKGMLRDEADRALGPPAERSEKREGGVAVTTLVYDLGEQRVTAEFVEDVLVRYTIASK